MMFSFQLLWYYIYFSFISQFTNWKEKFIQTKIFQKFVSENTHTHRNVYLFGYKQNKIEKKN